MPSLKKNIEKQDISYLFVVRENNKPVIGKSCKIRISRFTDNFQLWFCQEVQAIHAYRIECLNHHFYIQD